MTTATLPPRGALSGIHLSFGGVLRSEWVKLRSLRSTLWCLGLVILLTVGFGLLLALNVSDHSVSAATAESQKSLLVQTATLGVGFTQLIVAVLGVLVISGEYTTGMIRSTFTAVPGRLSAFFGKIVVLGVTTFVVGAVAIAVTALVTAPILSGKGLTVSATSWDVLLPMIGGAGYLALLAVLALAVGAILRSSAGGIAVILGLVLVIPPVLQVVSSLTKVTWIGNVAAFLPSEAGGKIYAYHGAGAVANGGGSGAVTLDSTQGLLVLIAWVVVGIVLSAILVKRRDA